MKEYDCKSYYALVWNTALDDEVFIEGKVIGSNTELPKDPRMLYGANTGDILKVRNVEFKTEVTYDVFTTKQSVRFIPIIEEFNILRDVRIIVWEGSATLHNPYDYYRIVTPDDFEEIVRSSTRKQTSEWKGLSKDDSGGEVNWQACSNPESKMSESILGMLSKAIV